MRTLYGVFLIKKFFKAYGWKLWLSGLWRRILIERLWVRIPVPHGSWMSFTCISFNIIAWENQKEAGDWIFFILDKFKAFGRQWLRLNYWKVKIEGKEAGNWPFKEAAERWDFEDDVTASHRRRKIELEPWMKSWREKKQKINGNKTDIQFPYI